MRDHPMKGPQHPKARNYGASSVEAAGSFQTFPEHHSSSLGCEGET